MATQRTTTQPQKLGFLGPVGTFTEELVSRAFNAADFDPQPFPSNRAVLEAVAAGDVDQGVVPIENSLEGTVSETVDTIMRLPNLWVTGELMQPIRHHLIGLRGAERTRVTRIISHPQAYGQCQLWLSKHLPQASFQAAASTAKAVQQLGSGELDATCAAIGNRRAAEANEHTEILAESIQDSLDNTTRFVTVATTERSPDSLPCKTSIAFSTERDTPGSLVDALLVLKTFRINMTKIETRPEKKEIGDYLFLIDFLGHHADAAIAPALDLLRKEWVTNFRLLGSYPELPSDGGSR